MKVTVKGPDGNDIEVELPDGFGRREDFQAELQEKFDREFARRSKSVTKAALDEALQDAEFRKKAMDAWGVKPHDPAEEAEGRKLTKDQLSQAQRDWEQAHLNPLKTENETLRGKVQQFLDRALNGEILAAAQQAGVHKYLTRAVDGGEPAIVAMFRSRFGYDEESGSHYVRKGDRFAVSTKPTDERMYMGADEYFQTLKGNKEYGDLFEDTRQRGPGSEQKGEKAAQPETPAGYVRKDDLLAFGMQAEKIAKGEVKVVGAE